ncbi:MAG TPA: glycosyltransferase [bacterium]|nr:glycosyltransferase [bacterium]
MIVTTSHATIINGHIYEVPANTLVESLKLLNKPFIFVRHSMNGDFNSEVFKHDGSIVSHENLIPFPIKISFLRYFFEIFFTIIYFLRKFHRKINIEVFFGVDPLNTVSGLILRRLRVVKKVIFYSVDYSKNRFENKLLNFLYQKLDTTCTLNSDEVWSVSTRIVDLRRKMGLEDRKNVYIPNVPSDEYKKYLNNKKDRLCMVTLGIIGSQLEFTKVFITIKKLKKDYPNIKFKIIGSGPMVDYYKKQCEEMGIQDSIIFMGTLGHTEALEEISKSGIGLALYNGSWSFNYYGDSMKCREYFCFGLPVLTTDTHSTVEDILSNRVGLVVGTDVENYVSEIKSILKNYENLSKNSYDLARVYDDVHLDNLKRLCSHNNE